MSRSSNAFANLTVKTAYIGKKVWSYIIFNI